MTISEFHAFIDIFTQLNVWSLTLTPGPAFQRARS